MRTVAQDLAELMGKSRLDLAKALIGGAASVTPATRSWLAGLRRVLAKAKPAPKAVPAVATAAQAAADFHRKLKVALGQDGAPAKPAVRETPHRYVTVHTGDPNSPGHTLRMVPHPTRPGVWNIHEADRERARQLLGGKKKRKQSGATQR